MSDAERPPAFPHELRTLIEEEKWTFASTYAKTWPHEYIVRDRGKHSDSP